MKASLIYIFLIYSTAVLAQNPEKQVDPTQNTRRTTRVVSVKLLGSIKDARSGEILPGASIVLTDQKIGASADVNGHYTFNQVAVGHHVIEVSHSGYATQVEHIELTGDVEKDFSLQPVITENQAVIVTGVTGATSIRKAPIPVTTIRKSALLQSGSTNIIDALTKIPGVSQLSTGPAISKPVIRGLGYNRVVTINEGVRQEGQQWGDEHGIEIDELSVARAEVLKGPASLMYGSDAIAGVINLITNVPGTDGAIKGSLYSVYQTNNRSAALNGNISGSKNGFNWNAYGTLKSAGDYKNKYDGYVLNSRFREKNFGGYIGLNKSWGFSHLIFSRFDQHTGVVEGDRDDATGKFLIYTGSPLERIATNGDLNSRKLLTPYQHITHTKLISDNSFSIDKSRLKINLGLQQNLRKEYGDPENSGEPELSFDLKTFNYTVHWQLPEFKEWHTTIGVNGMAQNNKNKAEEVLIPEYSLFDVGGFVYAQRFFKRATFSGGFRYDHRAINSKLLMEGADVKFPAFERNFSNVSGSLGISIEASERMTIKANVARGFRAPTLAELGSNGAHEGTNRYEYGNNQLKSEKSLQADLGFEFEYDHFNFTVSAFYNRLNDFIFYRKLESMGGGDSLILVDNEWIPTFQFDQHDAKLYGIEASFDIHPHPLDWLHFENSFSYVRGKFDETVDGSNNLPLIPAAKWTSELRANLPKLGKSLGNFYFRIEADNNFKQTNAFTGFDTETETAAYTLFNAGIGADIKSKTKTLFGIHLAALNIFDKAYQQHLSRLKYADMNNVTGRMGVFNTGRNFSIRVYVPLEFKY